MKVIELLTKAAGLVTLKPDRVYDYQRKEWILDPNPNAPKIHIYFNSGYVNMYSGEKKVLLNAMEKQVLHWKMKGGILIFAYYSQGKMVYYTVSLSDLFNVSVKNNWGKRIKRVDNIVDYQALIKEMDTKFFDVGEETHEDFGRYALVEQMR